MSLYKRLAKQFIDDIQSGQLAQGSRLPSLRQLSKQHSVSMSTAVSCYQELESAGWIAARPQAGYYVRQKASSHSKPTWTSFKSRVSTPSSNAPIYSPFNGPLGVSNSDIGDETALELERGFRRVMRRMGRRLTRYPEFQGERSLRDALSNHFSTHGIHFQADDLVITSGCLSAIKAALESCSREGDAIAISSPCFNGIIDLLGQMSRKIVEIPSLEEGIDLDQLETHFKQGNVQAGVFCTSHMNPQGITMSTQQKQRLASMANQYRIPVIEDDVYVELSYADHYPLPAKYYDTDGYILWCGSFSKSLSPSYRLGWCLPGRYLDVYRSRFGSGCYGVAIPLQLTIADFIESGHYAKHLKRKRFELLNYRTDYLNYLSEKLSAEVLISGSQGGLVLWLQVPGLNGEGLANDAMKHQLDIRIGQTFTTLDYYKDCVRINIGHPLQGQAKVDLQLLVELIEQNRVRD
ncbi:PLP-dependent aminotransferase family protein [Vibrio sp. ZSDE26]|uniref:PLP-dependent aminotransferase family protein n=1 Tax=Vibrio amylolyticus TaxID=2847292 RepID=A0A9X2BHS6_9VIBR|nr:PLP-dependent aminotransferase family protein [Vibrio amylolyticus]MCK6264229.1 PLP-dependent aminotransferase family protein [Vibrio amylolyticus]